MFIFLTLAMVVLSQLMPISVAIMATAAVWGVALLLTRPGQATPAATPAIPATTPAQVHTEVRAEVHTLTIPKQTGERMQDRAADSDTGQRQSA